MLTTVSIAQSCLTETWATPGQSTGSAVVLGNPYDTNCWNGRNLSTTFSPAICPSGYSNACDAMPHSVGETVWACCPTGFTCDEGTWSCLGDRDIGITKTYNVTITDILGSTVTTQLSGADGINAHSIRVAFRSSDLIVTPASTTSSIQATLTITSIPTSDADIAASNSGTFPIGATVGIGIGVGAAVFLIGVAGLAWRRYRKRKQVVDAEEKVHQPLPNPDTSQVRVDLSSATVSEMDGAPGLYELDTRAKYKMDWNHNRSNS